MKNTLLLVTILLSVITPLFANQTYDSGTVTVTQGESLTPRQLADRAGKPDYYGFTDADVWGSGGSWYGQGADSAMTFSNTGSYVMYLHTWSSYDEDGDGWDDGYYELYLDINVVAPSIPQAKTPRVQYSISGVSAGYTELSNGASLTVYRDDTVYFLAFDTSTSNLTWGGVASGTGANITVFGGGSTGQLFCFDGGGSGFVQSGNFNIQINQVGQYRFPTPTGSMFPMSPTSGYSNTSFTFAGLADPNGGILSYVDVYVDGVNQGRASTTGEGGIWSFSKSGFSVANHSSYFIAANNNGKTFQSNTVSFTVLPPPNSAPSISLDGIAGNGTWPNYGYNDSTYSFWGSVSDPDGNLSYIDVYVDGVNRGRATISGGSWNFSIAGTSIGGHSTYAIAYDAVGASTQTGTPSFTCYQRDPSVSIQILDASKNVMGLNGNGRAQLTSNQSFYIRINGYDPDARLATLYSRLNNPQGGGIDYPAVSVSGANASYDFGPYNVGTNLGVWNVWGHAYDHDSTNQSSSESPDVEVVNTTNTTNWFTLNGNSADISVQVGQAVNVSTNASDIDGNMTYSLILWDAGRGDAGSVGWGGIDTAWSYQDGTGWSNYSSNHGYSINPSNNTITATFTPQDARDYIIYPITYDNSWNAASGYSRTVRVSKATPVINISDRSFTGTHTVTAADISATSTNPHSGAVVQSSLPFYIWEGSWGQMSAGRVLMPGTYRVLADSSGSSSHNYNSKEVSWTVSNRAPVNQSMTATNVTVGGNTHITARSTDADGNLTKHHYVIAGPQFPNGNNWEGTSPSGHQWHHNWTANVGNGSDSTTAIDVTMTAPGTYYLTLNSEDAVPSWTYNAGNVMATFTVSKASPSISFGSLANMNVGASTTLSASLNGGYGASGITYSVVSQNGATAHVSGNTLTIDSVTASPGQITVRASYAGDGNNNAASSVDQVVQVNAIGVSLTSATTQNFTFNGSAQGPSVTWSSGSGYTVTSGTISATNAGSYSVSVSANYPYSGSGTINWSIAKVTPTVSWSTPTGITYGTALSSTQLNATASVGGSFVYSPASGSVLGAGSQTLSVNFTPTDTTNYNSVNGTTVTLAVAKANQTTLTASASPTTVSYGATSTLSTTGGLGAGAVTYSAPSGSISGNVFTATSGSGTVIVTATKAADTNYNQQTGTVTLTMAQINQSAVTITGAPGSLTYGTTSGALTAGGGSGSGAFSWSINSNGTLSSNSGSPTVTATTGTGTITVTLTKAGDSNYNSASTQVNITAGKVTPTVSWSTPSAITYGTALSSTQLNATASVPGTFTYTPASGTVLGAGSQTLSVHFVPTDTTNYSTPTDKTVSLTVGQATPTVSWTTPAGITYGTALSNTQLNATASVPGTFTYAPVSGTVLGAGNQTLSVNFAPTDSTNYKSVNGTTVTLAVAKATPVITWATPSAITYGTALSSTQLNASSTVAGAFTYSPVSGTTLGAGIQTLTANFTPTDTANYNSVNGTAVSLTVNKASPAITFSPVTTLAVGGATTLSGYIPTGSVTYSIVNADGTASLSGSTLTINSMPASGKVTVRASYAGDTNNNSTDVTQDITITQRVDTITTASITSSGGTLAGVGDTVIVPATTAGGVTINYTVTSNGIAVPVIWSGSSFTVTKRPTGSNAELTITAQSSGDTSNTAVTTVKKFTFNNHAPTTSITKQ